MYPGDHTVLASVDCAVAEEKADAGPQPEYPMEYLNAINLPGIPPHRLLLTVGVPVMLLCNPDLASKLFNGTQLQITWISPRVLCAVIMTGNYQGRDVMLPRIALDVTHSAVSGGFRPLQFPIQLSFAMTINKASLTPALDDLPADLFHLGSRTILKSRWYRPLPAGFHSWPAVRCTFQSNQCGKFQGLAG